MTELEFRIEEWLGSSSGERVAQETMGSLHIVACGIPLTEVEDTMAASVRQHIRVPGHSLAQWLLMNWWRLRWEPLRYPPSSDWMHAHSMAAIGGDNAWPNLTFASDGQFVQICLSSEDSADVSPVRYLRDVVLEVQATDFESAVDRFIDRVQDRLTVRIPGYKDLLELREELMEERASAELSASCRLQAMAGFDPATASDAWLDCAKRLSHDAGPAALEELVAAMPVLEDGLGLVRDTLSLMRNSRTSVMLDLNEFRAHGAAFAREYPWQRGARLARDLRTTLALGSGPLSTQKLNELLDVRIPVPKSSGTEYPFLGGYRDTNSRGLTTVLVKSAREDNQRFYFSRLIAAACVSACEQAVLPVSGGNTALQKIERSFAQEFLCPWEALDAFTDEKGIDEDGITDAAEYFNVSDQLIQTTLVNKKKLRRDRLHTLG